jgi:hypothetical protein
LEHLKECENIIKPCVKGCGLAILGKNMQKHIDEECQKTAHICKVCEEEKIGGQEHDCIKTLKQKLKAVREINRNPQNSVVVIPVENNPVAVNVNIMCSQNHLLVEHRGPVSDYNG